MPAESRHPVALLDDLRAILAVDKLPIAFLLGAGCPCSIEPSEQVRAQPFIPDARGLTTAVLARAPDDLQHALELLKKTFADDGQQDPTIEHMLTRVRTMAAIVGNDKVRGFSADTLDRMEQHICGTITAVVDRHLPEQPTPYHLLARWIGSRETRSVIFTTNYDLLVEQALESVRVPFFDGFVGAYRPFFSQEALEHHDLPEHWALLCKLHGSVNWRHVPRGNNIVRSQCSDAGTELLIHPSHLKYAESRRMPYFVMLDQLKAFINNGRKPAAFFIVGYSFSDEHINHTIADSLQSNPSAVCYAFQFDRLSNYPHARSMAARCANLHVIARDQVLSGRGPFRWRASGKELSGLGGTFVAQTDHEGPPTHEDGKSDQDDLHLKCLLGDFAVFADLLETLTRGTGRGSHSGGSAHER